MRVYLLEIYVLALLHDYPALGQVVGISTEPPMLFKDKRMSEEMILAKRSMVRPEDLARAKREKDELGLGTKVGSGIWRSQEFPQE